MSEHRHWRSMFAQDEKFLGSWNLEKNGKYEPVVVHIERFYSDTLVSSMGKESKIVAKLKEFDKPIVVNRTNFSILQKKFNSFDPNDFLNKPVVLTVETVKSPQGLVDALRFSSRDIPTQKKLATIKDEDFPAVIEKIQKGELTIEKLKTIRELSVEQLEKLNGIKS